MSDSGKGVSVVRTNQNPTPPKRRSGETPPFRRRTVVKMFVMLGLLIAANMGVLLMPASWLAAIGLPHWARFFSFVIYSFVLMWWIRSFNRAAAREQLRVSGGIMICWDCGYELPSPDDAAAWPCTCPECGTRWTLDDLYHAWRLATPAQPPAAGASMPGTSMPGTSMPGTSMPGTSIPGRD
jgi:hypothetical protein